jgi:very-short-patch-repair endonuclease
MNNDQIIENSRKIIQPYELDIYIPKKKIAIEFNGLYWHSSERKEKDYHYQKYKKCKEKGIKLIQIFEDD